MFKSGNVLSSNGRGIVREVRVAVFAVISRHIRRRYSLSFSLSLSFFFFFFFFVLLYYSFTYVWVVFGWNICCEERDKASFGQLFSFLGLIFAIFSPFWRQSTPQKLSSSSSSEFTRGSIFHIYTPQHTLLGGREREERTSESTRREK